MGKRHVFRALVAIAVISAAWPGCSSTSLQGVPDDAGDDGHPDAADAAVDEDTVGDVHDERDIATRPPSRFTTVWGSSPADVYVMGSSYSVLSSALRFDGSSWSFIGLDHVDPFSGFALSWARDSGGSSSSDVFVVGLSPLVPMMPPPPIEYAWHYDGVLWSSSISVVDPYDVLDPLCVVAELRGIWSISSSSVWVAGHGEEVGIEYSGIVLHFDGTRWSLREHGRFPILESIWGASDDAMFAVGWEGTIVRRVDGAWESMESPVESDLLGIWGQSARDIYAVGDAGVILHYDGIEWTVMESGTEARLNSVWGAAAGDIYAVGDAGSIMSRRGDAWMEMDSGTDGDLLDVWGSSAADVYAVGQIELDDPLTGNFGVIVHFDGASWQMVEDLPWYPSP